jgi:FixJ family two-component response regulator
MDDDPATINGISRVARDVNSICIGFTDRAEIENWLANCDPVLFNSNNAFCLIADSKYIDLFDHANCSAELKKYPKICISKSKDVSEILGCFDRGLFDFVEKPFTLGLIKSKLGSAFLQYDLYVEQTELISALQARFEQLTARELEVCQWVVHGLPNKDIAENLSISIKTVKAHRARVMTKTQASSLVELVRYFDIFTSLERKDYVPGFSNMNPLLTSLNILRD